MDKEFEEIELRELTDKELDSVAGGIDDRPIGRPR